MKKTPTFPANNLATTVGATDLTAEIGASQPRISIPVVEEVEYEFDQQKYEEYVSSSGSTSSPKSKKFQKFSSRRKVRWCEEVEATNDDLTPFDAEVASGEVLPASKQVKSAVEGVVILSKRARQRQRQRLAKQFAKAMESVDGVRYHADLKNKRGKQPQQQMKDGSSKPSTMEWVRVKRDRSTLEERIRKRRALSAQARAKAEEARRKLQREVAEKQPSTRKVWKPKSGVVQTKEQNPQPPKVQHPANQSKRPVISATAPGNPAGPSQERKSVLERLGPIPKERGKAPVQERLGPMKKSQTISHAGGRRNPQHLEKIAAPKRTTLRIEVQEPAGDSRSQRRVSRRATLDGPKKINHPQKEMLSSDDDDVIPGRMCQHTMGCSNRQTDELYYRAGGTNKTRKRSPQRLEAQCPCSKLIRAVLSECNCVKTVPDRVSVFERLSVETPKPRHRRFQRRRIAVKDGEHPRVTANMTNRGTSIRDDLETILTASRPRTRL